MTPQAPGRGPALAQAQAQAAGRGRAGATAALVLATLFWAGNYVVGAELVKTMSPLDLTWLRWALACVPLIVVAQLVEKPDWRRALRSWRRLLVLAALGIAGYNLLLYTALEYTTALSASLINAANPALIAVLAALLLKERLGWRLIVGLALGLVGVLLVITHGDLAMIGSLGLNLGDLLMLGAILVWALYSIVGRGSTVPPITSTALQAVAITIGLAPFSLADGLDLPSDPLLGWALVYVVVFPSLGSYVLWNSALRTIPPAQAGLFLNLITVFTVVISLALGQGISVAQALGGMLVFAGVAVSSIRPVRPRLSSLQGSRPRKRSPP